MTQNLDRNVVIEGRRIMAIVFAGIAIGLFNEFVGAGFIAAGFTLVKIILPLFSTEEEKDTATEYRNIA